jgi:hypothetical protein
VKFVIPLFMPESCWTNQQVGERVIVMSVQLLFSVFMTVANIYAIELRKMHN